MGWLDDYMCCNNPFHFTLLASATCTIGQGFSNVQLEVTHIDPIEFKHNVTIKSTATEATWYSINYGSNDAVEQTLRNLMTLKEGHLMVENADGSATNALETV